MNDINNRFECLVDDNYRKLTGRLPANASKITDRDNRFDCLIEDSPRYRKQNDRFTELQVNTDNRFDCLIEDSPRYRKQNDRFTEISADPDNRFSRLALDASDSRKKVSQPIRKPPDIPPRMIKESVNQRIKRLKESGEFFVNRPRSNTTQLPIKNNVKRFDEEFPSLNKNNIISNSAPSSPIIPDISHRLIIQELPLPPAKYVSIGIKNGKYFEQEVYSMEDSSYVPEPRVLVIKKPVYNKWSDLLRKRDNREDVYVNSLCDGVDVYSREEKFEE